MAGLSKFFSGILTQLRSFLDQSAHAWGSVQEWLSVLPIGYVGIFALVLVSILFWMSRFVRRWRSKLADNTIYSEHPTMVQGDFRSLSILLLLIIPFVLILAYEAYAIVVGEIAFDPNSIISHLIFAIPFIYISTGFLGFVIWNGVSHSEEVVIEPTKIKVIHKIPIGEYLLYAGIAVIFKFLLFITFFNFRNWIQLPLEKWGQEIKLAGGGKIKGNNNEYTPAKSRTLTIFASSIDSIGEEEPLLLRFRNIGHLVIYRIGEDPLELQYLPNFRLVKSVVLKLSDRIPRRRPDDGMHPTSSSND